MIRIHLDLHSITVKGHVTRPEMVKGHVTRPENKERITI